MTAPDRKVIWRKLGATDARQIPGALKGGGFSAKRAKWRRVFAQNPHTTFCRRSRSLRHSKRELACPMSHKTSLSQAVGSTVASSRSAQSLTPHTPKGFRLRFRRIVRLNFNRERSLS
jgi:hypothetical protein